jgi:hypothetical protein
MVLSSDQGSWNRPLDRLIEIEHGNRWLGTLADVGGYILALPETVKRHELWQAAAEAVLYAAESDNTTRVPVVFHMAALLSGQITRSASERGRSCSGILI